MENMSGQGKLAVVPPEIDSWNWGAFLLNGVWGVFNGSYIALLMFVPFVNLVLPFILGVKGSAWAWQNKRWDSVEHFRTVQRRWAAWGAGLVVAGMLSGFFVIPGLFAWMKHSEPYKMAEVRLAADAAVAEAYGSPLSLGWPQGSLNTEADGGSAQFQFSVEGPRAKGTAFLEASRQGGRWRIDELAVEQEGTGRRIEVGQGG